MKFRADDARVACPLFQAEYGGSTPTSALQLVVTRMDPERALALNRLWHSRLPELGNAFQCKAYGAHHGNVCYAVTFWSHPVARMLNGRNWLELRRMAVAPDAPKNTPSWFLGVLRRLVRRDFPDVVKLISYQDTEVHKGTIYKAAGWSIGAEKKNIGTGWNTRPRGEMQSTADKIRWELDIEPHRKTAA